MKLLALLAPFAPLAVVPLGLAVAEVTPITRKLAAIYALGEFTKAYWLLIPEMAVAHGTANAIGFGFIGMIGWLRIRPQQRFTQQRVS